MIDFGLHIAVRAFMNLTDPKVLLRHIQNCNSAQLPGKYHPFRIKNKIVGWINPDMLPVLEDAGVIRDKDHFVTLDVSTSLQDLGKRLIKNQTVQSMNELFDVYPSPHEKPIGQIDRSVLPLLGFIGTGVHLNGLVKKSDGIYLWVGKRSPNKRLDPGKLDHIVAGGIPAGLDHRKALFKEAEEEASIPENLIEQAQYVSMITYSMQRPEGLRRDVLYCYDLWLPEDFLPTPNDGEVVEFRLMKLQDIFERVCLTDDVKFNVNLVLIDLFLRQGLIPKHSPLNQQLKLGLRGKLFP